MEGWLAALTETFAKNEGKHQYMYDQQQHKEG